MVQIVEVFFSYAHVDEELMSAVRRQMIIYERNGRLVKWYDRKIPPGDLWRESIDSRIRQAKVILLFLSPHFIESRYCFEIEGNIALERARCGEATVIPVILRPCAWQETPYAAFQALPKDGHPLSRCEDVDQASLEVAQAVAQVATSLQWRSSSAS